MQTKYQSRTFISASTVEEALAYARSRKAELVSLKFTDLHGTLQQTTVRLQDLQPSLFEDGIYFDGSSLRGWQPIEKSDMIMIPDPETVIMDPFTKHPTVSFMCDIYDGETQQPYTRDPRFVARKATQRIQDSGIAEYVSIGPEIEFYLFKQASYSIGNANKAFYEVDSNEGSWSTGSSDSLGYIARAKEGYFPAPPFDKLLDIRSDMIKLMDAVGLNVECAHHEVGSGGQCEIDFQFDGLLRTADKVAVYKYIVRNVAYQHNLTATFLPKPLYGDNGNGMHQHYSLHKKDGTNIFAGDHETGLSQTALYFIGGIIHHSAALCSFTNPTTNSYKRLIPGYEAPIYCVYSARNRSAFIRIPCSSPKGRRIEFRTPDPTCNPYLAFSAVVQAGLDGIEKKLDPGEPQNRNLYALSPKESESIKSTPVTLQEAIQSLKEDNDWLKKGNVFTDDLLDVWIERKNAEIFDSNCYPTPFEFHTYFDA